jgi:hypothetical protein
MDGACDSYGGKENSWRIFVRKLEERYYRGGEV